MIADLLGAGDITDGADVVVVGAGTVGLVICSLLARKGLSVVCLESGSWRQDSDEHALNEVVQTRSLYKGAAHGRFRCLGGTSTRWGGALIPFQSRDMQDANWPISFKDIDAYRLDIEALFGLTEGPYDRPDVLQDATSIHLARLAKWPPFNKRNVFNLLSADMRAVAGPRIWINATATEFRAIDGRLDTVVARAPDGSRLTVAGKTFIMAAGAIETTRLLLILDQQNDKCLSRAGDALGRYFQDHLSTVVADLDVIDRTALNRLFGFRFERNGSMRNLRFELAETTEARCSLPPCFAHVAFEPGRGGFDALRDLYRHMQQRRLPPASTFLRLAAAAPWLARAAWWRFVERRLLYPGRAKIQVHMVVEQVPRSANRIALAASRVDMYGLPLAQIDWSIDRLDVENLKRAVAAFERTWNASNLASMATFRCRPHEEAAEDMVSGGGIYHPTGSTRMANDASSGVVNKDLALFSLPNVRVLATSVLPTGGGANPTMTLLMLAARCVEQIANDARSPEPHQAADETSLSFEGA